MREQQLRQRLRKQGYRLRKKGIGYMIIEPERNYVVAGGEGNGFSLSLDDVADYLRRVSAYVCA
jgi:hypothetical protein